MVEKNFSSNLVNPNEDDQMEIFGYRVNRLKQSLTWLLVLTTVGMLQLVFFWKPKWMLYCTHSLCSVDEADKVLMIDKYEQEFVEKVIEKCDLDLIVPTSNGHYNHVDRVRYIVNKKTRYLWDYESRVFRKLTGLDFGMILCNRFYTQTGLSKSEQDQRLNLFGVNLIEIDVQPLLKIFIVEVLNPFYIYQFFAIIFWAADHYFYYASYILVMSIISLSLTTYQLRVNQKKLRDKVYGSTDVLVLRNDGQYERINSSQLVPGDVLVLDRNGCNLHCDAVLLSGEVIVDEAMLTGESNPVTKTPIRNSTNWYHHAKDGKHTLFSGTSVIQVRQHGEEKVRAIVVRINFQTAKGEIVRSILFPKPIDFKFNRHINHFLCAMAVLAFIGFIYTVSIKIKRHDSVSEILFKALDLITIVVPPELPAALTIATIFVEKRLRKRKIFCMSPRSINISGCVDCCVFDKTGTLTENEVDLEEVLMVEQSEPSIGKAYFSKPIKQIDNINSRNLISECLATCHSLKLLEEKFIGENLEIKLFTSTQWSLVEPSNSVSQYGHPVISVITSSSGDIQLAVLKQFPFTSKSARMSVVVKQLHVEEAPVKFYIKGAPEVIINKCLPKSIPLDFSLILNKYTEKSYRVLAVAYKSLASMSYDEIKNSEMENYEHDLTFLGLVVMRNKLKITTLKTITTLNEARIRLVMATGDNLMTALSVSRECGITSDADDIVVIETQHEVNTDGKPLISWYHRNSILPNGDTAVKNGSISLPIGPAPSYKIAMTGHTFKVLRDHYPAIMPSIVVRAVVFARMAPEQKQQLVELLQSIGYYVAMCGDGANDCGALKVAHAGISLSDTEASVASSFTSLTGEISCVPDLLREGRASLVSVFGIVRYMACYNITTFLAICILYYYYSALTDIQNLYQDIAIISVFVFLFGRSNPHHTLSAKRPPTSLIGITQFSSILLQLCLVAIFQLVAVSYLHQQPWFTPHRNSGTSVDEADNKDYVCHDNYALFIVQLFQYVVLVIIFSKGAPYRRPLYRNKLLTIAIIVTTAINFFIVLTPEYPFPKMAEFFGLEYEGFPLSFRFILIGLVVVQLIVALLMEKLIVEGIIMKLNQKYKKSPYDPIYEKTCELDWIPG